jgi:hypothetical protein
VKIEHSLRWNYGGGSAGCKHYCSTCSGASSRTDCRAGSAASNRTDCGAYSTADTDLHRILLFRAASFMIDRIGDDGLPLAASGGHIDDAERDMSAAFYASALARVRHHEGDIRPARREDRSIYFNGSFERSPKRLARTVALG